MPLRRFSYKDVISGVRSNIQRLFPRFDRVWVDLSYNPEGLYTTKIIVKANRKECVATKHDPVLSRSIEKANAAILKQLQRLVGKRRRIHLRRFHKLSAA